ncbi:LEAF RUST 10 DISEASE-RESISTANCE LOCUS RECEPTOR-LIKE PROTEIN KINASE-like 2.4 [Sesamum alatum]|uniref:non-specific serine/threonine protein kinase n=1 Tax=Sesamum alatum TaxID=300844 RepID=A0AAE1XR51_9LAMI|nr:LEAF RUST 10 DISEASE-RESISTANCE LOCUS RECEPTOR-LIKE PROTEIN KINASE-like 2.4 [Sesamum alatum]
MKRQYFSRTDTLTLVCLGLTLPSILNLPQVLGAPNEPYTSCGAPFNCGKIAGIGYPFWGGGRPEECGHPALKLDCENGTTTTIQMNKVKYRVLDLNQGTQILKIARDDLSQSLCPQEFTNTTLDPALFEYASGYVNLTLLYGCRALDFPVPYQFDCPVKGVSERNGYVQFAAALSGVCHASVVVPISFTSFVDFKGLEEGVRQGFEVRFKVDGGACRECESSGGRCGYDVAGKKFVCFCPDGLAAENNTCPAGAVASAGSYSPGASAVAPSASSGTELCLLIFHFHERNLEYYLLNYTNNVFHSKEIFNLSTTVI